MTIFTWLLLAHLIGDWTLQNDWMARHKQDSLLNGAIAVHCLLYTAILLVALWLAALNQPVLVPRFSFAVIIFLSHWLIDAANLAGHWSRIFQQSNVCFVRIMVDQTMHLVVLACLVEFLR
jgi:hypothetical protein